MRAELLQIAADLAARRQPFVLAMVVRRQPYSSAHQGDMAVITADGSYHGWLGGNCTQPVVKREAARALIDGQARLLSLSPEPAGEDRPGVTVLPMVCQSGGTVDVYLEPFLPPPRLVLFGLSPVVRALAQLGKGLGYSVDVVDPEAGARPVPGADRVHVEWNSPELQRDAGSSEKTFAVVATMGEHDDEAVTTALGLRPAYLGVVASRTRFAQLREGLLARGVSAEPLDRIRNPAGLDIGARLPEEVALSILAEIVQLSRAAAQVAEPAPPPAPEAHEALDPVCGMTVVVATARHRTEHAGRTFFFCNPRCRERFIAAPECYLTQSVAAR